MLKRVSILLASLSLALVVVACNKGSSIPSSPTPIPSPSFDPTLNTVKITVTKLGTPAPHIAVEESTPRSSASPRPGTPFETLYTKKSGIATFKGLKKKTYCWVAVLSSSQTSSTCAGWEIWQNTTITLGT